MAIEERHGKKYFYRKKRVGKKVVSEYVGGSEFDLMLAEWQEYDRKIERHEKNMLEAERYELEKIDWILDALEYDLSEIITAHLVANGFYKTSSREWRYKNG